MIKIITYKILIIILILSFTTSVFFILLNDLFINSWVLNEFILFWFVFFWINIILLYLLRKKIFSWNNKKILIWVVLFFLVSHVWFYNFPKVPYVPQGKFEISLVNDKSKIEYDWYTWIDDSMSFDEKKKLFLENNFTMEVQTIQTIPSIPFLFSHRSFLEMTRARYFYNYSQNNAFKFLEDETIYPEIDFGFPIIAPQYGPSNWKVFQHDFERLKQ